MRIFTTGGNHRGKPIAGLISTPMPDLATAESAVSLVPGCARRVIANKYLPLAAFSVIWTLANMILVDIGFDLAFNEQPYQILKLFIATH